MQDLLHKTIPALWLLWLAYWIVSASRGKPEAARESNPSRRLYYSLFLAGAVVLSFPNLLPAELNRRWITDSDGFYALSAVLVAAGVGFACVARAMLGGNWSATVTLKQDHELICRGPYRYVRHPIYTGLLLATFGTALETGAGRGAIGFALIAAAISYKYRVEEHFLTRQFGDDYRRYQAEVPALLPFWPRAMTPQWP